MPAKDCSFWARPASCVLLLLLGCSPKYELLRTSEGGDAGGSSSGSQAVGGTMSRGATDSGGSAPVGGSTGGSDSGGYTSGGTGFVSGGYGGSGNALGEACTTHGQCAFGTVCSDYSCQTCPVAPATCPGPCANGFRPLLLVRNGCAICECVPPSQCSSNPDCPDGKTCYAGAQCEDGCRDSTCCFGNRCSQAGCGDSRPPQCLAFGCNGGESCLAACDATSCECDGSAWVCESTTGGTPVASCPQACAPP